MKNLWSDRDAAAAADAAEEAGLGLAAYATRLLGGNPQLVLHGGGNTSVKAVVKDLYSDDVDVMYIKGSGLDMANMQSGDFPALRLEPLRRLALLEALPDAAMTSALRAAMVDPSGPMASVETLAHAFLPHRNIHHTHADAILALTNRSDGEELCRRVFGRRAAVVPYAMSGLTLAKAMLRADGALEGMIIARHGLFSFGETASQAYRRMIDLVSLAEEYLAGAGGPAPKPAALAARPASVREVAPVLRGLAATSSPDDGDRRPFIMDYRAGPEVLAFVNGGNVERYAKAGNVTPDHVIRIKPRPLIIEAPEAGDLDAFAAAAAKAMDAFEADYRAYFERHCDGSQTILDAKPRVILMPGLGLFGLGRTAEQAAVAADLAECTARVVLRAERLGDFVGPSEGDLFDIEYWAPERAKLAPSAEPPLLGRVAVVTGGASGIGLATARMFAAAGAAVAVLDLDGSDAGKAAAGFGGLGLACDVTDGEAVNKAFGGVVEAFGGVDILVSNAGRAWQGTIGEVDEAVLRKSFELNFWGHQKAAQAAVAIMKAQGTGGCLLFNASKQALNPGRDFGPYGLPKAAVLFLMKQYALDHGRDGIRSNAINADRICSGLLSGDMIAARSRAREISESEYMSGNLLGREVTADDVARGFLHLALSPATTAATLTVDGGNIEASLR